MAVNKIVYGNDTLVDLTSDTISASDLAKGKTAHDKSGNSITGTFTLDSEIQDQDTVISQIQEALAGKTAMPDTSDANAAPSDIRNGKSAYVNGTKITGSVLDIVQGTPSISVSSTGLITAKATQSAGFVSDGTKSSTKQLTVQEAQTITPSLSEQTIASGRYLTGTQTISAITKELLASLDSDFIADNIAEGVDLFGLVGTLAGASTLFDKEMLTGSFVLESDITEYYNVSGTSGKKAGNTSIFVFWLAEETGDSDTPIIIAGISASSLSMGSTYSVGYFGATGGSFGYKSSIISMPRFSTSSPVMIAASTSYKLTAGKIYNWIYLREI